MKVSIIIPSLDGDRDGLTKETLRSCHYQQGFIFGVDYEVILQQADETVGKNINDGVAKAKGKYIKLCADDDLLTPNCLMDLYTKAEEGFDIVCADAVNFYEDGTEEIFCSHIPERVCDLAERNSFHGGTLLYRRETMLRFNEDMWTAEEYDHSLRSAAAGLRFGYVNKVVFRYRIHDCQKSGAQWEGGRKVRAKRLPRFEYIYGPEGVVSKYLDNRDLLKVSL